MKGWHANLFSEEQQSNVRPAAGSILSLDQKNALKFQRGPVTDLLCPRADQNTLFDTSTADKKKTTKFIV